MKIIDKLNKDKPTISFEFFPPKTEEQETQLFQTVSGLKKFNPDFVSVTYGAMGTTRGKTFYWAKKIKDEFGIEPVAHLTCISATKDSVVSQMDELSSLGVSNLLALRGDPPADQKDFILPENGFKYAKDLVAFIKKYYPNFCVGVAGFPEGHCSVEDLDLDTKHLKDKIEDGGEFIITQLFFDNEHFFRFRDRCRKLKIYTPIIPGLMTVTGFKQIQKFTKICGATMPKELLAKLEKHADDPEAIEQIGTEHTIAQCKGLLDAKVSGLHFFVMNQSGPISRILGQLRIKA